MEPQTEQLCFKTVLLSGHEQRDTQPVQEPVPEDSRDLSGSLRAPERWEQLLVDAAVIGGKDRWERRLRGLENEVRLQIRELGSESSGRRERLHRKLALLANLSSFALPVIDLLDRLPARASWSGWLSSLEEVAVRALRYPESVLSVLAELKPMGQG